MTTVSLGGVEAFKCVRKHVCASRANCTNAFAVIAVRHPEPRLQWTRQHLTGILQKGRSLLAESPLRASPAPDPPMVACQKVPHVSSSPFFFGGG